MTPSRDDSSGFVARRRKRRAGTLSAKALAEEKGVPPENPAGAVMHYVEEGESGQRSQRG